MPASLYLYKLGEHAHVVSLDLVILLQLLKNTRLFFLDGHLISDWCCVNNRNFGDWSFDFAKGLLMYHIGFILSDSLLDWYVVLLKATVSHLFVK